ncbi:MAG: insulinase family protein [Planctomycetaceae bacterium]|nr:insulinase family protein [Planctomycetaceae bacterium]
MRTTTTLFLTLLLGFCASSARAEDDAPNAPPKKAATEKVNETNLPNGLVVHEYKLANGMQLLLVPDPSAPVFTYQVWFKVGSADEKLDPRLKKTGLAHFFEHMMFRGSENFPGSAYDELINGLGADANAYTTDDYTAYHLSFVNEDLPKVIEAEADRFQRLNYGEEAFKTESGAVYGEFRKGRTSPFSVLFENLQNTAFDEHTYKHTTIGFEADVERMPTQFAYSKTFFQRFYRPENVVILVTGDFDAAATLETIEARYGGWEKGYEAPKVPVEPEQTAPRRLDVAFEGQTLPLLAVMFKGPAFDPTDRTMVAGSLIGELAFGETSPLYQKLVLDEQRVEALYASFDSSRDPGLWGVIAMVKDPADVRRVESEILATVAGLRDTPVTTERLDDARARAKYGYLSGLTTADAVAQGLVSAIALTGGVAAVDQEFATLAQVTPEDVKAAADAYLTVARSTTLTLAPKGTALPEPLPAPEKVEAPLPIQPQTVLMPVDKEPVVSLDLWFKVGSQDDPPGKEGLAALTGALISEGATRRRSYADILAALYPMAASYSAAVDREMTVVHGRVHAEKADDFRVLFAEALTMPAFNEADFKRLRDEASSYIKNRLRYSSDEELGKAALYQAIFAGTPYAHIEEGTVESLAAITLDDVRAFWKRYYTLENVVVGVGGGYPDGFVERLEGLLQDLPRGEAPGHPEFETPPSTGRHLTLVEKPGPSTAISFGHPIDVLRGSREYYALLLATSWLGEHRNSVSHLYKVIREARGMNYGDYAYIEAFPNGGRRQTPPTGVGRHHQIFEVWIRPVPEDQAVFALRAALREVERFAQDGLTEEQFEGHRKFLEKYALHLAESTSERLGYAVDDRFYGLEEPGHLAELQKVLPTLTLEEVNAAIRKHVRPQDLTLAMVTAHPALITKQITTNAATPITYPEGVVKPQEILDEDKLIESWPVGIAKEAIKVVPVDAMFQKPGKPATK